LHFKSLDEAVADAVELVSSPTTRTLGNWSLSQLLTHLARAIDGSIDGIKFKAPWFVRLYGKLAKRRVLRQGLSPGFKLPKKREAGAFPSASSLQEALAIFRKAVGRLQNEKATASHPVFGKLTHEEWTLFHLRHAELHQSFAALS
jgi:hypothetical protein